MAYLFKNTPLQINFNVNLTCLLPGRRAPRSPSRSRLDLKTILQHFLDFRLEVVTRRLEYELENLLDRIHILEGFAIVFNNLDEAIRIIRAERRQGRRRSEADRRFELDRDPGRRRPRDRSSTGWASWRSKTSSSELAQKQKRAEEIEELLDDEPRAGRSSGAS